MNKATGDNAGPQYKHQVQCVIQEPEPLFAPARHVSESELHAEAVLDQEARLGSKYPGAPQADNASTTRKKKNKMIMIVVAAVVVTVAIVIGGVCGSGACSGGDDDSSPVVRSEAILNFVNSISLTTGSKTIFYPPVTTGSATPEELAVQWLIDHDPIPVKADTAADRFRLQQRFALLTLWFQDTVSLWTNSDGWLKEKNECAWFGITCVSTDLGGDVGVQNVVTRISLRNNNIFGRITDDIALLTSVTNLDISENSLVGTLPESIGDLTNLETFTAHLNAFTGTLPASIGQWTSMQDFKVWENTFTGSLPESFGDMTNMLSFSTGYNRGITGTLPASIGQWTLLQDFFVGSNRHTGTVPSSIASWTQIETAHFFGNGFIGSIPSAICSVTDFPNLRTLEADCVSKVVCSCCTKCV